MDIKLYIWLKVYGYRIVSFKTFNSIILDSNGMRAK